MSYVIKFCFFSIYFQINCSLDLVYSFFPNFFLNYLEFSLILIIFALETTTTD